MLLLHRMTILTYVFKYSLETMTADICSAAEFQFGSYSSLCASQMARMKIGKQITNKYQQ